MAKRWPPENYALLNDRLQDELGSNVILVGSKGEADVSDAVEKMSVKNRATSAFFTL